MDIELFDYDLPQQLIAQQPHIPRDECRLMVCNKKTGKIEHRIFKDLIDYLDENDLLVLNNTKVIPARLLAKKPGGGKIEIFLLKPITKNRFYCLTKGKFKNTTIATLKNGSRVKITKISGIMERVVEFENTTDAFELLESVGEVPLPPYIKRDYNNYNKEKDFEYYQTVFAKKEGAVASPTAGLHFTQNLIETLKNKGIKITYITLHVGIGTFMPVKEKEIEKHKMHSEEFEISKESAEIINYYAGKGRTIAVGTTVVRALEAASNNKREVKPIKTSTDIFIYPGYKFKIIDGLITNFHLPKSTLLMLVSAFYKREKILDCYKKAIDEQYRFFSFGDAMFIF